MNIRQKINQVVFTNKARCRDCHRCVRVCPVKAINVFQAQAFVVDELCIACGTCIEECPQGAKSFRKDTEKAREILDEQGSVSASIAPSFAAEYSPEEILRLPDALRKLGFSYVSETSMGAYYTAEKTKEYILSKPESTHLCTACPAFVSYVEKYQPALVDKLVPVISPMIAHAEILKQKHPMTKVIFIGPCVAKKREAFKPEYENLVDCVLTFTELNEMFASAGIDIGKCQISEFDKDVPGDARYFPLVGGLLKTAHLETGTVERSVVSVSGHADIMDILQSIENTQEPLLVEPLFCRQGCINGPGLNRLDTVFERRKKLMDYVHYKQSENIHELTSTPPSFTFEKETVFQKEELPLIRIPSEEEIFTVLKETGHENEEDRLNCQACGYHSCTERAIAVINGMAEREMCIPYMRILAEQKTDSIIETSPNGILILDKELNIISMNPAFKKYFQCTDNVIGKRISLIMDSEPFERLATTGTKIIKETVKHEKYGVVCYEIFYEIEHEQQYAGVFVNITEYITSEKRLEALKFSTVEKAKELLENQIRFAQEMSKYLGENTARGEELVDHLLKIANEKGMAEHEKDWLWGI